MSRLYGDKTWKAILDETLNNIAFLNHNKGEEYKADDNDQLANFRRRAIALDIQPEVVWGIYAGKHMDALETYIKDVKNGKSRFRSEPLAGRIDDLIMYLILLKAMVAEREAVEKVRVDQ